jgi:hypothetical protein
MKRIFLIIISALLLSMISNGQWYNRRYGVSDLNQLSREQLDLALTNANFEFGSGIFMVVVGGIGLYGGIYLAKKAPPGDIGGALGGLLITAISVPLEIAGWVILTINLKRIESIKEVMKSRDLRLGLSVYPKENRTRAQVRAVSLSLSLSLCFQYPEPGSPPD